MFHMCTAFPSKWIKLIISVKKQYSHNISLSICKYPGQILINCLQPFVCLPESVSVLVLVSQFGRSGCILLFLSTLKDCLVVNQVPSCNFFGLFHFPYKGETKIVHKLFLYWKAYFKDKTHFWLIIMPYRSLH